MLMKTCVTNTATASGLYIQLVIWLLATTGVRVVHGQTTAVQNTSKVTITPPPDDGKCSCNREEWNNNHCCFDDYCCYLKGDVPFITDPTCSKCRGLAGYCCPAGYCCIENAVHYGVILLLLLIAVSAGFGFRYFIGFTVGFTSVDACPVNAG